MQANSLPAGRGWHWFAGGLRLWQRGPATLAFAALLAFVVSGFISSLPWVGSLLICTLSPFIDVFLLRACHAVTRDQKSGPRGLIIDLVRDLKTSPRSRIVGLLGLGLFTFVCMQLGNALITLIAGDAMEQLRVASEAASAAMSAPASQSAPATDAALASMVLPPSVQIALLLKMAGIFAFSCIMWIAPALTAFADVPPVKSLFFSIVACWRNKAAFIVFGLSVACLSVPLGIFLLLGGVGQMLVAMLFFGVLMPTCVASNYLSVTDIFGPILDRAQPRDLQDAV